MTDTTTVASLKKQIETAADIIRDLSDKLEAERQRADANEGYFKEMEKYADKLEKAGLQLEAEIAELKGDQVPVGYVSEYQLAMYQQSEDGYLVCQKADIFNDGLGVFTAPQKPVVLPKSHYVCGCADRFMSAPEVIAAIEAAGGIVKDGE